MRAVIAAYLARVVACSGDPQRQDLEMFCSSDATAQGASLPSVGEYVLAHAHGGTEVAKAFAVAKEGSLPVTELARSIAIQLDAERIADCPTYTKLWGAIPRSLR